LPAVLEGRRLQASHNQRPTRPTVSRAAQSSWPAAGDAHHPQIYCGARCEIRHGGFRDDIRPIHRCSKWRGRQMSGRLEQVNRGGIPCVAADARVVKRIEALETNELQELILRLTHYAEARVRFMCKWFPSQRLAGGVEGKDLAMDAITRVLQGRRRWDPDTEPDLLAYLKSVVKSILHDRVTETRREAVAPDPDDGPPLIDQVATPNPGPEQNAVAAEETAATNRMLEALDKEEDQLVFLSILDGTDKPAEIARALNRPVRDIYRIKQKIMRRLLHWKGAN